MESNQLLNPEFLRKLERLSVVAKKLYTGQMRGERRSSQRGASVEFADYRNYSTGDDFRRVDWNVFARLEKLFLKLFIEEQDLHVYVLLDTSRSMDFGTPTKLLYAKQIAAALGYIALCNLDRVGFAALTNDIAETLRPKRGKQSAFAIFNYLESIEASLKTNLASSIRDFSLRTNQQGMVIIISDFFDEGYQKGVSSLLSRGFEVTLIQVLDEEEINPSIVGDLTLVDSETGEKREVSISQSMIKRYKERLSNHCSKIEDFGLRYGCNYVQVSNQSDFESLILNYMRRREVLK